MEFDRRGQAGKLRAVAQRLYTAEPTAEEAARYGLTLDEVTPAPVPVYPENLSAVNVFVSLSTQWRVGFGGAYGLDYGPLLGERGLLSVSGIPFEEWQQVMESIRVMEDAALLTMKAQSK